MKIVGPGVELDLPTGWEAEIDRGAGPVDDGPSLATPRVHIANFALGPDRGDFGSGAVERMRAGDILVCLLEEAPAASGSRLHSHAGLPRLGAESFSPAGMQRPRSGLSGAQAFFHTDRGRAFALYVVLADTRDRAAQLRQLERVLSGIRFTA